LCSENELQGIEPVKPQGKKAEERDHAKIKALEQSFMMERNNLEAKVKALQKEALQYSGTPEHRRI
jgi:hypothetical protein